MTDFIKNAEYKVYRKSELWSHVRLWSYGKTDGWTWARSRSLLCKLAEVCDIIHA